MVNVKKREEIAAYCDNFGGTGGTIVISGQDCSVREYDAFVARVITEVTAAGIAIGMEDSGWGGKTTPYASFDGTDLGFGKLTHSKFVELGWSTVRIVADSTHGNANLFRGLSHDLVIGFGARGKKDWQGVVWKDVIGDPQEYAVDVMHYTGRAPDIFGARYQHFVKNLRKYILMRLMSQGIACRDAVGTEANHTETECEVNRTEMDSLEVSLRSDLAWLDARPSGAEDPVDTIQNETKVVFAAGCDAASELHYFFFDWLHDQTVTRVFFGQMSRHMTLVTIGQSNAVAKLPFNAILGELGYVGLYDAEHVVGATPSRESAPPSREHLANLPRWTMDF